MGSFNETDDLSETLDNLAGTFHVLIKAKGALDFSKFIFLSPIFSEIL